MADGRAATRRCGLTPERWQRLRQLFDSAVELESVQRDGFLREACAGDESLRAEAAALLARHENSAGFLESSALELEARALARDVELHGPAILGVTPDAAAASQAVATMRAHRVPWWIWLLAAVFLFDCLLRSWCRVLGPEPFGYVGRGGAERLVIESIRAGSAVDRAGCKPGDVLLGINGQALRDPPGWGVIIRAVDANLEIGGSIAFDVKRDGRPLQLSAVVERTEFLANYGQRIHMIWQLNALLLLGTAMFIAFKRPRDTLARLGALALATLSVGLYFTIVPPGYTAIWRDLPMAAGALLWIPNLCVYLVGPIVLTFFASFPRPLFRARWPWAVVWLPALLFVPVLARDTYHIVYEPAQDFASLSPDSTLFAGLALFGVYGVASVTALAVNYARLTDLTERRRLRVLLLGGAVATLPSLVRFLVGFAAPQSGVSRWLDEPLGDYLLALLFVLFPVCFAYSILRHRLFDIRVIVRQGLQYAMARGVLVSLVPLLALVLVVDLLLHGDEPLIVIMQARGWAYAGLGFAALIAHSQRHRWADALDRRFFREHYDARRLLLDVAAQSVRARDFNDATPAVIDCIDVALHPEFVAVMRRQRDDTLFLGTASSPAGTSFGLPPLLAEGALVRRLRSTDAPLRVAQDDAGSQEPSLTDHDREFLRRSRSELLVPIAMSPAPDEALLVLGARRSEQPYTRDDCNLLSAIAANLGVLLARPQPIPERPPDEFLECPQCGTCHETGVEGCPDDGAGLVTVHMPRMLAGRYHLERRLGRGGMASVYEATDRALGRRVAVKVIREDRLDDAEVAQRFRQEARAAAGLSGPNIVTVHDYGVEAGRRAFLVMELLKGMTLRDEITRNAPLGGARTLQVFRGACSAVDAAHRRLLIHRDLKPENIFLARTGEGREVVKVLDFGIAKFLSGDAAADPGAMGETSVGLLVGTPNYISPEQLLGERSDVQSDIWALGVTAYECLTGALPFPTHNRDDWRRAVLAGCYTALDEHLSNPPARWQAFFADSFSVERAQRPRTVEDFMTRLERALGH